MQCIKGVSVSDLSTSFQNHCAIANQKANAIRKYKRKAHHDLRNFHVIAS
jgi:hypothetical protein